MSRYIDTTRVQRGHRSINACTVLGLLVSYKSMGNINYAVEYWMEHIQTVMIFFGFR